MLLVLVFMTILMATALAGNFYKDVQVLFGDERANMSDGGKLMCLSLDNITGSGFVSNREYLFGSFDMHIKLVPNDSAGTVTTYYLSSQGPNHDEIDFEFLGNATGQPYKIHTNVYCNGQGNREQQFYPWFDPTTKFHKFMVDNIPIRVFNNNEAFGVPFPNSQPMKIYSSIWNADSWATEGGLVKTNWTYAPFTACYKNFNVNGTCVDSSESSSCGTSNTSSLTSAAAWETQGLDPEDHEKLMWVQNTLMVYNYCTDYKRFPDGCPSECYRPRFLQ
ncbi:hypothetical protein Vadar_028249 [Vaccinium darrowii]|uniref:Uncharacterized protein n=1 Tax=Vaccinium darrowii TaxID=229202 RepID=A0ACB7Z896_9ERIC|nr:hypothetical protein Vadar_028249 [Vaccinium darrowii]